MPTAKKSTNKTKTTVKKNNEKSSAKSVEKKSAAKKPLETKQKAKSLSSKTKKTNQFFDLSSSGKAIKQNSGIKMEKPRLLYNEKTSKMELLKQSNYLSNAKKVKGKNSSYNELPEGVRKSAENKERMMAILNNGRTNDVDEIRKKFLIDKGPLTKKRASEIKIQRMNFFKKNIEKNKKGKLKALDFSDENDLLKKIKEDEAKKNEQKFKIIAKAAGKAKRNNEQGPKTSKTNKKSDNKKSESKKLITSARDLSKPKTTKKGSLSSKTKSSSKPKTTKKASLSSKTKSSSKAKTKK